MKSIRVGVIGVGNIGTMHADNIYQNKIEGMELTAVCDAKGIQSENIAACVKHFCVNNKETNRKFSDSRVSERALREIYLKAFEIVIGFKLPPFAYWTVEEWKNLSDEYAEMKDCQIGWDVTDFGSGDFHKKGLFLMTIRNGKVLVFTK